MWDLGPQAEIEMRIKQDVQESAGGQNKENKTVLGRKLNFNDLGKKIGKINN